MAPIRAIVFCLLNCAFLANSVFAQASAHAKQSKTTVARGVQYEHLKLRAPAGEPWSVHVLRVERGAKGVTIRAASAAGEMRRELPTEIAKQEMRPGEELLAVVNGDYDIAAPFLGVSDGLSITSGHLWTTGKSTWPALALRRKGEPLIAVPQVRMELRAGKHTWPVAALNKPLGSVHGTCPRVYTRDLRESIKSDQPFRAIVVGKLTRPLPLRANRNVRGEILRVVESTNDLAIPADAIVVAERLPAAGAPANASSTLSPFHSSSFMSGQKIELRIDLRMAGRRDLRNVIGGFPIVVQNGKRTIVGEPGANLRLRNPRTAVCYNRREIIFVVVDGRQPQLSVGMTLEELGDVMVSLGCTEAMNTDGGGSSVMAVTLPPVAGASTDTRAGPSEDRPLQSFRIVNSPSDGNERGRGNAWVILTKR